MGRPLKKKLKTIARKTRRAILNFVGENRETVGLGSSNISTASIDDAVEAERASSRAMRAESDALRADTARLNKNTARLRADTARMKKRTAQTQYRTGMATRANDAIARYRERQIDRIRAETAVLRAQNDAQQQRFENNNILFGG